MNSHHLNSVKEIILKKHRNTAAIQIDNCSKLAKSDFSVEVLDAKGSLSHDVDKRVLSTGSNEDISPGEKNLPPKSSRTYIDPRREGQCID